MITYVNGDLFESPAKVLVNTVNTVGVMGKGIAKTFKAIYPDMFSRYQTFCEKNQFTVGQLWLYKTPNKWILNFPTKKDWRNPSKPEFIEEGLRKFVASYGELSITSIAFPRLGCGNGDLDWERQVKPLMTRYLANLPIDIFIYENGAPLRTPEHKHVNDMYAWLRTEPRTLPFDEMWTDLKSAIGKEITLQSWDNASQYRVSVLRTGDSGLKLQLRSPSVIEQLRSWFEQFVSTKKLKIVPPDSIFIPEESLLDLWQVIREHGFCIPRLMPAGLDIIADYIIPILAKLPYMKPVELATESKRTGAKIHRGLQLLPAPASPLAISRISSPLVPRP